MKFGIINFKDVKLKKENVKRALTGAFLEYISEYMKEQDKEKYHSQVILLNAEWYLSARVMQWYETSTELSFSYLIYYVLRVVIFLFIYISLYSYSLINIYLTLSTIRKF